MLFCEIPPLGSVANLSPPSGYPIRGLFCYGFRAYAGILLVEPF